MAFFYDEKRHLYEALLRHNYFPNQKENINEIPPCFSSRGYTPEIAELVAVDKSEPRGRMGYDCVEYNATRYNNYPRTLSLIHPGPYAKLVKHIHDSWGEIRDIKNNNSSMIKPEMHDDGRIIIMNYEDAETKTLRELDDGFGKLFKVRADISGCFNNIYSHSIPWSVIGVNEAKLNLGKKVKYEEKHWSDQLDYFQRVSRKGETHGLPIGPGTSSIICEIILKAIDKTLSGKGFVFRRYIDDYTCYCESHNKAKDFLHFLGAELSKYKLSLNLHKTKISNLPDTLNDYWVSLLNVNSPQLRYSNDGIAIKLKSSEILNFLDYAVHLNNELDGGSVLKYAISLIIYRVDEAAAARTFEYILNLCWHYPILIPYLEVLIDKIDITEDDLQRKLNSILLSSAYGNHSDGMAWILYYCLLKNIPVEERAIDEIMKTKDCLSICILDKLGVCEDKIKVFTTNLKDLNYNYDIDKYWILFYQRYFFDKDENPYLDKCFEILKENDVDFMPLASSVTQAEKYCEYLNNPFLEEEELLSYDAWCTKRSGR